MTNGAYLVNGTDSKGHHKSGVAWYANLGRQNDGKQPDAYADIPSNEVKKNDDVVWEGHQVSTTFPDNNTFTSDIESDAQSRGFSTVVGSAKNNFQSYQVFKDDNREVFEKDGYTFQTVYWCQ